MLGLINDIVEVLIGDPDPIKNTFFLFKLL